MTTTDSPSTDSAQTTVRNPFLEGPFGPVAEEVTLTDLPVTGSVPEWLDGRYLRNGPNPIDANPATYHWFLGDPMVHGVRLRDGRAEWYRNRWVRTPEVAEALDRPQSSGRSNAALQPANTNVVGHGGRFYAIAEFGIWPYELTEELETVGPCDFDGTLPRGYTAHPHRDPVTGELHAISYFGAPDHTEARYQYSVLGTDGRFNRLVDFEVPGSPIMHDFALSENYAVLLDLPVTIDVAALQVEAAGPSGSAGRGNPYVWDTRTAPLPITWDPDHPARLGLLPREGDASDIRWFPIDPCYVFHPLNAYEESSTPGGAVDRVVVDVVRFPTMFTTAGHNGPDAPPMLYRWTIDLGTGVVGEEQLDDHIQEFPRVDERLTGRRHRYGYTVGLFEGAIFKHDLVAGSTTACRFEPGDFPSEFVFVPATPDGAEDDGVLMGFVERAATKTSDLVLLDAASLDPVATLHLPVRVPAGFHGNWIPT